MATVLAATATMPRPLFGRLATGFSSRHLPWHADRFTSLTRGGRREGRQRPSAALVLGSSTSVSLRGQTSSLRRRCFASRDNTVLTNAWTIESARISHQASCWVRKLGLACKSGVL